MPSYLCPRCGFKTSQRANFKRHLTRKHKCEASNSDVTIKSIAYSYGIEITPTDIKYNKISNNFSNTSNLQTQTNTSAQTHTHTNVQCKYCNTDRL